MTTLLTVRLPDDLGFRLDHLAKETGRSKSYYLKIALEKYLVDREDSLSAAFRLKEKNPRISYEKMRKKLGL